MSMLFQRQSQPPVANQAPSYVSIRVQTSCYGVVLGVVMGTCRITGNIIWSGDFQAIAHTTSSGGGGGGGKGGGGGDGGGGSSTTYTYSTSVAIGISCGPVCGMGTIWKGKDITSLGALGGALYTGQPGQAPWGYLVSKHPDQAIGYSELAYVALPNLDLGESNSLPNLAYEVVAGGPPANYIFLNPAGHLALSASSDLDAGLFDTETRGVIGGLVSTINSHAAAGRSVGWDTHVSWCVKQSLTAPWGVSFPMDAVGNWADFSRYCIAHGYFMSVSLQEARAASEVLDEWVTNFGAEFVWSDGVLQIKPYSLAEVSGNGLTWLPDPAPVYDLGPDDFVRSDTEDASPLVKVSLLNQFDTFNRVKVEFLDRSNSYNTAIATAEDPAHIATYGLREAPVIKAHHIQDPAVAQAAADILRDRHIYVTTKYEFPLGWKHCRLEAMDLVTLTDPEQELDLEPVLVTDIEEDESGRLVCKGENVPDGIDIPRARIAFQAASGFALDTNVEPGDANAPYIFEPPMELTGNALEVWMAASGGPEWGGCIVWVSEEGDSYQRAGAIYGSARMGVLASALAAGSSTDTVNSLAVDLSMSRGELSSGSQADAQALNTLCWVGGEYLAYQTAALTGENAYALSYLVRGAFGTSINAHPAGTRFARLDAALFRYAFRLDQIGKTVKVKLQSFNRWGGGMQDTADIEASEYTIVGPKAPPSPVNLFRRGDKAVWEYPFSWPTFSGFRVRVLAGRTRNWGQGRDWPSEGAILTVTELDIFGLGAGEFTIMVRAVDVRGQLSDGVLYLSIGLGEPSPANVVLTHDIQADGFPGKITNGKVIGGILAADDAGERYLPNRAALYLPVRSARYLAVFYQQMVYEFSYVPGMSDVPAALLLQTSIEGEGWHILYRRHGSGLYLHTRDERYLSNRSGAYLGGVDPWSPWPGSIHVGREKIDFRIVVEGGSRRGRILGLKVIVDVPDIEESFDDLVISPDGTRIPLTKSYRVIDYLGDITIQDDGHGAVAVRWVNKDPVADAKNGPQLVAVDSNNVAVQATVDIRKLKGH